MRFSRLIWVLSLISTLVTLAIFLKVAADITLSPDGDFAAFSGTLKAMIVLLTTVFCPGFLVTMAYLPYAYGRLHGRAQSYALEMLAIVAAALTVFAYYMLQKS